MKRFRVEEFPLRFSNDPIPDGKVVVVFDHLNFAISQNCTIVIKGMFSLRVHYDNL